ncbi:MAG: RidA family protein [Pseudomonadota bacterium]
MPGFVRKSLSPSVYDLAFIFLVVATIASFGLVRSATAQPSPFSRVVDANGVIYLAGHLGRDPETRVLPEGIRAQTTQTLRNIGATLAAVNATHADIVRCQVFLDDINNFDAMNAAYRVFFPQNPPARTTVAVKGLALNAKIEIECTAVRGHASRMAAPTPENPSSEGQ